MTASRAIWALLIFATVACGGTAESQHDDLLSGVDAAQVEDWGRGPDAAVDTPVRTAGKIPVTFRYETRFGTTGAWKGLTVLSPAGVVHTETAGESACEVEAKELFLEQLYEAVGQTDPFSWDSDLTPGGAGCGSDAFLQVLVIETLSAKKHHEVRWCSTQVEQLPGLSLLVGKIEKLAGAAKFSGECELVPYVIPKPTVVSALGYDDGLQHVMGVARVVQPGICLVVYSVYSGEVYRTNRVISQVSANLGDLGMFFPPSEVPDFLSPMVAVCPEAAQVIRDAQFVADLLPPVAVFLVEQATGSTYLGVSGVVTVEAASLSEDPAALNNFNLNDVEFRRVLDFEGQMSLDFGPWDYRWVGSATFDAGGVVGP